MTNLGPVPTLSISSRGDDGYTGVIHLTSELPGHGDELPGDSAFNRHEAVHNAMEAYFDRTMARPFRHHFDSLLGPVLSLSAYVRALDRDPASASTVVPLAVHYAAEVAAKLSALRDDPHAGAMREHGLHFLATALAVYAIAQCEAVAPNAVQSTGLEFTVNLDPADNEWPVSSPVSIDHIRRHATGKLRAFFDANLPTQH